MRWILLIAGCAAEVSYMPLNRPPRALYRRGAETVELFTADTPKHEFVEVGFMEATSPAVGGSRASPWVDAGYLVTKMRKEAGDYGCDGLVIAGGGSTGNVRGTCIVYK